jgi:hypothetical protein
LISRISKEKKRMKLGEKGGKKNDIERRDGEEGNGDAEKSCWALSPPFSSACHELSVMWVSRGEDSAVCREVVGSHAGFEPKTFKVLQFRIYKNKPEEEEEEEEEENEEENEEEKNI